MIKEEVNKYFRNLHSDWDQLSDERKQMYINRSRNYLRFKMTRLGKHHIPYNHPLLTSSERDLTYLINKTYDELRTLKCQFFSEFYDNCTEVGSTLKRKKVKIDNLSFIDDIT